MLSTNYNLFFSGRFIQPWTLTEDFSGPVRACVRAYVAVCICLSVVVIIRREVMRRARNFGISFTRNVNSAVQDRGLIRIRLIVFRSALQHLPFPTTFIKLSLKNVS